MVDGDADRLLSQEASGVQDWLFLSSSQLDDLQNSPDGYELLEPKPAHLQDSVTMESGTSIVSCDSTFQMCQARGSLGYQTIIH